MFFGQRKLVSAFPLHIGGWECDIGYTLDTLPDNPKNTGEQENTTCIVYDDLSLNIYIYIYILIHCGGQSIGFTACVLTIYEIMSKCFIYVLLLLLIYTFLCLQSICNSIVLKQLHKICVCVCVGGIPANL